MVRKKLQSALVLTYLKNGKNAGQVLTLENNKNLVIDQTFNFGAVFSYIPEEKPYFTISFNYAKP